MTETQSQQAGGDSLEAAAERLESANAEDVVSFVAERFGHSASLACSFQKEESVLLHMVASTGVPVRVFALDTGLLFEETYATWRLFEDRFGIEIEAKRGISLEAQASAHGDQLWSRDPNACCGIRKVAPLKAALGELEAWITGVRRDQSPTRANAPKFGWDGANGLWKASPLADWSDKQVWAYIHEHDLPYNPLHDSGYSSIGCTHCTQPGEGREGRWAGADKTECGLHPGEAAQSNAGEGIA